MNLVTVSDLSWSIKKKIFNLDKILDALVCDYKSASEIIDRNVDHRQKYLDQLEDLDASLTNITNQYPTMPTIHEIVKQVADIISIASSTQSHSENL